MPPGQCGLEYVDCIPFRGVRYHPHKKKKQKKTGALSMKLNCF